MFLLLSERFEVDIPRPAEAVAKALSDFTTGSNSRETLNYKTLPGKVTGMTFAILARPYDSGRGPSFYFYGTIHPLGDRSRVSMTLKTRLFVWIIAAITGFLAFAAWQTAPDVLHSTSTLTALATAWAAMCGIIYLNYLIAFLFARGRKAELVKVMTYYGTRVELDSVD